MKFNPYIFGLLALVIFMGTILTAQATGNWSISGKVSTTGEKIVATGANPDEIKGWMTLGDVNKAYGLTMEDLGKQFGLPPDTDPKKQIKDVESETFSPEALKTWLKERTAK